jgi:ABC-2 type transport system permease protein
MRNILLVAKREYREQIRGRAFLLSTILLPALFACIFGVGYLSTLSLGSGKHLAVASDDPALAKNIEARLLRKKESKTTVDLYAPVTAADRAKLDEQLKSKSIDGLLDVESTSTGIPTVTYTSPSAGDFVTGSRLEASVDDALVKEKLTAGAVNSADADALLKGVKVESFQMRKDGSKVKSNAIASFYKGYVMAILLSMTTMIYGMNVARSIIQEKTTRIFEVLLATAKPGELLAGKLIGVGAVGLTQIAIWVIAAAAIIASPLAAAMMSGNLAIHFTWEEGILFPVYYVLGYLLYSSLFAGLAATCETEQELQMYTPLAALPIWLSFSLIVLIINDSNSVWSIVASCFPPCASIIMMLRMGSQPVPLGQVAISVGLLIVSIVGVLWFSAKLYRIGILMYGKRATLPEIIRWLRYS